jgi:hypothetical protein
MLMTLIPIESLHVLAGVFWAGTTFALARTGVERAAQLLRPQLGAAVVAVATGALLWFLFHRGDTSMQGTFWPWGPCLLSSLSGYKG